MKTLFSILFTSFFATISLFAATSNAKLSFDTYILTSELQKKGNIVSNKIEKTNLFIQVDNNYSKSSIETLGGNVISKTKSIAIVSIPIEKIDELSNLDFISKIEIAPKAQQTLDKAIEQTNVVQVHNGEGLHRAYFGKDVIVGVVDWGFDFTHPMFLDENGNSRVKRAWITADTTGNPPANYAKGSVFDNSEFILNNIKYSATHSGHGSHVLGIAGGSEVSGIKNNYTGIASQADLAIVDLTGGGAGSTSDPADAATIFAGVQYLLEYADSVGKPIVINLSLGYTNYYHPGDGESLMDIASSELLKEHSKGSVVVASAGNEGGSKKHFQCQFGGDDSSSANTRIVDSPEYGNKQAYLSFWGSQNSSFDIDFKITNISSGIKSDLISISTDSAEEEQTLDTTITCQFDSITKTYIVKLKFASKYSVDNPKPYIHITVINNDQQTSTDNLTFNIKSNNSTLHCWDNTGNGFNNVSSNITPDAYYTIGSPGSVNEVITVAAYVSKKSIYSSAGSIFGIANFSSRGPLTNGQIKPDITAPGAEIFSAKNSFHTGYDSYIVDRTLDSQFAFVSLCGTSMSGPMVSGIVALMLELNPELDQSSIKDILQVTAINDDWTGEVKNNKNYIWGWGKIDAIAILGKLEETSIDDISSNFNFVLTPNPTNNGSMQIQTNINDNLKPFVVKIYDITGNLLYINSMRNEKLFNISFLTNGTYFVKLDNGQNIAIQKLVINK
jgi:hypothetical protein